MTRAGHAILIAGANGVVGAAAVQHDASLLGWQVLALSRRSTLDTTGDNE